MTLTLLSDRILGWLRRRFRSEHSSLSVRRGPRLHVIILDGTMSSLKDGCETNVGLTYKLLREMGSDVSLFYEPGVQWPHWRATPDVMMGRGINRQIRRAYGFLASRYRPGDTIYFFGYSRGAYAVRSLAGVIDQVGLLRPEEATVRNIRQIYRHYQNGPDTESAKAFATARCYPSAEIEMVGVWDTVKALGVRLPILYRFSAPNHAFHNHHLGETIKHGFHALALNETRLVYQPVLWECPPEQVSHVDQVWFRGTHGDVGGQLGGRNWARPLSNISLVWMLENAENCGLPLHDQWRDRFICDVNAPSIGTWTGLGKLFWLRASRKPLRDPSERLHPSVGEVFQKAPTSLTARILRLRKSQKLEASGSAKTDA